MSRISLPGDRVVERPAGTTAAQIFAELVAETAGGPAPAGAPAWKKAVAAKVNGEVVDVSRPIGGDATLEPVLPGSPEALEVLRHTSAHVLAQAVARHFGLDQVEFAIGPVIEEGFFYDFDLPRQLVPEDLPKIEELMEAIRRENLPIVRIEAKDREDALAIVRADRAKSKFKQELISSFPEGETVSFYRQGEFTDLCRGPHLPSTGRLASFKIMSIAGAYWRGDSKREQLQRIYATAFFERDELKAYVKRLEEAEKRDHRKVGVQLDLFRILPEAPGFPLWMPNGTIVFNELITEMRRKLRRRDYVEARTPHIMNADLWKRSGHWAHYRQNMYVTQIEERDFAVKPMNCPGAALVFSQGLRSYRDLPFRLAEFGLCHRYEESGALSGMTRVRSFVQDDAHVFCTLDQVQLEIRGILDLIHEVYGELGMTEIEMFLATRPADRTGTDAMWDQAEGSLEQALRSGGYQFKLNPGDGAFYGPKIDFKIKDAIGRGHQTATCQLDFSLPEKFDLEYTGEDGTRKRPVVIHRAIYGSIERFFAILIEHFAGAFPLWLAPEQAIIVPVSEERHAGAAAAALKVLRDADIRASVDWSNEKLGKKIRNASIRKVPYVLVIGDREAETSEVAVRLRDGTDLGALPVADVAAALRAEAASRSLTPGLRKNP
ncbi:MAG: threonine--tRNA ligase [Planctomycetes bacterium]|nr:threonine--tRNA ligase [Planctomycetota bacterium]